MKQNRFISSEQSIASFMIGFETDEMTYEEYNQWSEYLERYLSTKNVQVKVCYGSNYLQELECEDGCLFKFDEDAIKLAKGKTLHDLDFKVFSFVAGTTVIPLFVQIKKNYLTGKSIEGGVL